MSAILPINFGRLSKKAYEMAPTIKPRTSNIPRTLNIPYYWGEAYKKGAVQAIQPGYVECRSLIGDGSLAVVERLTETALQVVKDAFCEVRDDEKDDDAEAIAHLTLSSELQAWKESEFAKGNMVPAKGTGLKPLPEVVLNYFGAKEWNPALLTASAFFGCGITNMLIGGYDARTIYSNYVTDMVFYYEHSYHKFFPDFEKLIEDESEDAYARSTPGGRERREAVAIGARYIKGKEELEHRYQSKLSGVMAKMDRRTAQIVSLSEASLIGMAAEAISRGFDPAAVMNAMVWSSPATDVIDVGADLNSSEIMNCFLNTGDIADVRVLSEDILRRVYDAYSFSGARMLTDRWCDPLSKMNACIYLWQVLNDRHWFLRRAVLGYPKARRGTIPQQEADFDEVFDEAFRTTGFGRDLKTGCNGRHICDGVDILLSGKDSATRVLLADLWSALSTEPFEYAARGVVNQQIEDDLVAKIMLAVGRVYAAGLIDELSWVIAHASFHAWQVNHLFEAAMFGSLLDDASLIGKLDRLEY